MVPGATRGELEAATCAALKQFATEHRGRGPHQIAAELRGATLQVSMRGAMTLFERRCVEMLTEEQGHRVLTQLNGQLVDVMRPQLFSLVGSIVKRTVVSLEYAIDTHADTERFIFGLDQPPVIESSMKRSRKRSESKSRRKPGKAVGA